MLQWSRVNGCPWGEQTCTSAAESGHLEVLQWLRANGCPWILETYELAEAGEHYEAMAWMIQNGIQDLDGFFEAFTEDLD